MERLIKKLSMTCRSHLDEEEEQQKQNNLQEKISGGSVRYVSLCSPLLALLQMNLKEFAMMNEDQDDEEFLQQYRKQRMEEMRQQLHKGPQFRRVFEISSGEGSTLIMVHIYEDGIPGTEAMNGCMICLATEYPAVKFCRVKSSVIGASSRFTRNALPALLIYKGGELIGNFVRVTDQLGEDFFAVDLEAFLQEFGLLPEKEVLVLTSVRNSATCHSEDSDLEID
uniref:Phosducin domain-containing protein n=1 Tax=Castor canadensis TaxID=51338 RepID=A0A8C0ZSC0_CASCN